MGRYRGIGMPKAKKKKVPVVEVVEEMPAEEPPAPEPPDPPSTPPKKLVVVQPQSPSKTILLKAQHQARNFVKKAKKHVITNLERANALFEAESRLYGAKIKALERAEKRKPKPSGSFRRPIGPNWPFKGPITITQLRSMMPAWIWWPYASVRSLQRTQKCVDSCASSV